MKLLEKDYYNNHLAECWKEAQHYKETKDKIVFFIGTLFITVLFGSGFLIYSVNESKSNTVIYKLYIVQYVLMHLFFFLLFLYYTYNNVLEKIFSTEAQCCQSKILEIAEEKPVLKITPYTFIKKHYGDGHKTSYLFKVRTFKDLSNILMIVIYSTFSAIPLFFQDNFFQKKTDYSTLTFRISWLVTWFSGVLILFIVLKTSTAIINDIKKKIFKKWALSESTGLEI